MAVPVATSAGSDYLGFLCDAFPDALANPSATCGALEDAGVPIVASDLNYPSIAVDEVPGTVTVTRTVTSVPPVHRRRRGSSRLLRDGVAVQLHHEERADPDVRGDDLQRDSAAGRVAVRVADLGRQDRPLLGPQPDRRPGRGPGRTGDGVGDRYRGLRRASTCASATPATTRLPPTGSPRTRASRTRWYRTRIRTVRAMAPADRARCRTRRGGVVRAGSGGSWVGVVSVGVVVSGGAVLAGRSSGGVLLPVTLAVSLGGEAATDASPSVAPQPASSSDAAASMLNAVRTALGR